MYALSSSDSGDMSDTRLPTALLPELFRFVGCLPLTVRMGGRHRSMRAGVVQTPMEETAECPDAAGTCIAMGIGAVAYDVGLMVRSGEAGGCRRDAR